MRTTSEQAKFRRACYNHYRREDPAGNGFVLDCHGCGRIIRLHIREEWDADHIVPHALGGSNEPSNSQPLCKRCHAAKYKDDRRLTDKSARLERKALGIKRKSRPMPGTKASGWRKRMDGTVERR